VRAQDRAAFGLTEAGPRAVVDRCSDQPGREPEPRRTVHGDLDAARVLTRSVEGAELVLCPGAQHLFADPGLPSYDGGATALLRDRVLAFMAGS
jgi:hypothetical protein